MVTAIGLNALKRLTAGASPNGEDRHLLAFGQQFYRLTEIARAGAAADS